MNFINMNDLEYQRATAFWEKHQHNEHCDPVTCMVPPHIYYKVTPSGIGTSYVIVCRFCEEDPMVNIEDQEEDITDSDSW